MGQKKDKCNNKIQIKQQRIYTNVVSFKNVLYEFIRFLKYEKLNNKNTDSKMKNQNGKSLI